MENLAYKIDETLDSTVTPKQPGGGSGAGECAACGETLFGPGAASASWQAWGAFWEITGTSNVELVCGACGEYLQEFFKNAPDQAEL